MIKITIFLLNLFIIFKIFSINLKILNMKKIQKNEIYSISELNKIGKEILEKEIGKIWIIAEISNFSKPISGHWYFTLKDKKAQIKATMFRNKNIKTDFEPENGKQVLVNALVSLYETRGEYQLIIDNIQSMGEGLLKQKFEILKKKLYSKGLFSTKYKKKIPKSIKCLGIITSKTGAALYDILKTLKRRDPYLPVIIYPTIVQGEDAVNEICKKIFLANYRKECDVLIISRGGGSLEDLWVFNEEKIANAIFSSVIPIISAIGHEKDITISDLVADIRASTPSSAAELVSRNKKEILNQIVQKKQRLEIALDFFITKKSHYFSKITYKINQQNPNIKITKKQKHLIQKKQKILDAIQKKIQITNSIQNEIKQKLLLIFPQKKFQKYNQNIILKFFELKQIIQKILQKNQDKINNNYLLLKSINPKKILSRGYSITKSLKRKIITSTKQIKVDEIVKTYIKNGSFKSKVISIKK